MCILTWGLRTDETRRLGWGLREGLKEPTEEAWHTETVSWCKGHDGLEGRREPDQRCS